MYRLYIFAKLTKYIALASLVMTFFSDWIVFKWLCCLVLVDLVLDRSALKASLLQLIGMARIKRRFGNDLPSVENHQSEVKYSLPFEGVWVVVNGCYQKEYSHSWGIPTQRYAYDFIMLDQQGKSYHGEFDRCDSYFCYDKAVLSPAAGMVVAVVDGADDSLIFPKGRFLSRAGHIAGNYLVLRHAEQEYSTLAHLKKGSITVKVGDAVAKGQPVAKCGNTGNSTEPHLHFQLQTGPGFYDSAGLPIRFDGVSLMPAASYDAFDPRPHMAANRVEEGYLTRGFAVENKR